MTGDGQVSNASHPETALVVDADVIVRASISAYLRECGYRVIEASGIQEAKTLLESQDTEIGVVLSDVDLGGPNDGFSLARWIRSNRPGPQIILVATVERAAAVAGSLCEEGPLMAKPYDHQLLLDRVRQLLAGRRSDA